MLVKVSPGQSYFSTLYELNVPNGITAIVGRMSEAPMRDTYCMYDYKHKNEVPTFRVCNIYQ